ncbi:ThuA domain-containing protein [Ereboglobus luteus]|uniref:ThuA-like domain-containing protein n=1 Tax=Ereboglobus luteus TaxID=1796921 RepID=A0A2U8E3U1_9BACT|nr:ThuA domain-containing protein [Ereboglobus luteus]AWI09460.1 hypothetical protein CKA38_09565 [Ereboglobus luteus]
MKRIITLCMVSLVCLAVGRAQWYPFKPDPVITEEQAARLHAVSPASAAVAPMKPRRVLVFSRTCEFRHNQGIATIKHLMRHTGEKTGAWEAVVSDDLANFEPAVLKGFACVVLNNSTGMFFAEPEPELEKMPPEQQARIKERDARLRDNLIDYVEAGGGLVAFHAGADAYHRTGQYYARFIDMIGGNFAGHPWTSNDTTVALVEDRDSPITRGLWPAGEFVMRHETYMFGDAFDRSKLRVLMALDMERSPKRKNARADGDCALVWIKRHGRGRVAYSGFGHNMNIFLIPGVQDLHMRLVQFACGDLAADTAPFAKPPRLAEGSHEKK